MPDPGGPRRLALPAIYAALGAAWSAFATWAAPPVIEAAYDGRSWPILNRVMRGRGPHPLGHYLELWGSFSGAVLLAGGLHLALVLATRARGLGAKQRLGLDAFAMAFLGVTVLAGVRHDYVADLEIWDAVLRGSDPWWLVEGRGAPLNAYGPLFNALAPLTLINPLAPKLLFATGYLLVVGRLFGMRRDAGRRSRAGWIFLVLNPFPWVEVAYFGHFDVWVAIACAAAVHLRARGRDAPSGIALASGVLLKYLPLVILPFLILDGRRLRVRLLLATTFPIAFGMALGVVAWGPSTTRPLRFAATRGSNLLSIFRFLRGAYSPLRPLGLAPDADSWALPCLAAAGACLLAWCWARRVGPASSSFAAVLTTLLLYRVGFPQYQVVPFLLCACWANLEWERLRRERVLLALLAAYFGWLATFDVCYAVLGGVLHPGDRWAWLDEVVGLPTFLLGTALLAGLIRFASRPGSA